VRTSAAEASIQPPLPSIPIHGILVFRPDARTTIAPAVGRPRHGRPPVPYGGAIDVHQGSCPVGGGPPGIRNLVVDPKGWHPSYRPPGNGAA
jgi:hypothetical protein